MLVNNTPIIKNMINKQIGTMYFFRNRTIVKNISRKYTSFSVSYKKLLDLCQRHLFAGNDAFFYVDGSMFNVDKRFSVFQPDIAETGIGRQEGG